MYERDRIKDPEWRREHGTNGEDLVSVSCRVFATPLGTFFEVWQQGPGFPQGGALVFHRKWPRHTQDHPDALVMAAFLARMVSASDRDGWEGLR